MGRLTLKMLPLPVLLLLVPPLSAAETEAVSMTTSGLALQLALAMAFVLVAIFTLAWLAKRFGGSYVGQQKNMRVIGALPLGTREKAVLIEVHGKQILLGVAPGRVNALREFNEDETYQGQENATLKETPVTALSAKSVSEFSKKLQSFLTPPKSNDKAL